MYVGDRYKNILLVILQYRNRLSNTKKPLELAKFYYLRSYMLIEMIR